MTTRNTNPDDHDLENPPGSTRAGDPAPCPLGEDDEAGIVVFPLGRLLATPGAIDFMRRHKLEAGDLLLLHSLGRWGDVGDEDARANDVARREGGRLLSVYRFGIGHEAIWVITEADRSATTLLLPHEY